MLTLKSLKSKVKAFKENLQTTIKSTEDDLEEAQNLLDKDLDEPYTYDSAPDWVKKLPAKAKDAWIKAFNAAYAQYHDDGKAAATASAIIKKMGYTKSKGKWMKKKTVSLKESAPMGSFEYLRDLVREAINKTTVFNVTKTDGTLDEPYPYIRYTFLTHVIVEVRDKFYDIPFALSADNASVTLGTPTEVEEIFIAKESDTYFQEARGDGQGTGGAKQGDGGADKCVCPKCKKEYTHAKGTPCNKQTCPTCKVALVGKDIKEGKSFEAEIQESGIALTPHSLQEKDVPVAEFISLKEANYNEESGTVEVVIIEAGFNPQKKRLYPESTVRESAGIFTGMKMYIDHPTKKAAIERPERSIKDWASTITESHYENGKAIGTVAVHDAWLRERLADPVAREHIGISILTGGKASFGKRNGQSIEIVEKITPQRRSGPASVDWVTEAGARGRVSRLLKESNQKEGSSMEIREATFADLKKENPDLVESIVVEVTKTLKESGETQQKEKDLKEAQEKNATYEKKEKLSAQKDVIAKTLKESSLPEIAKERITTDLSETLFESETELKESLAGKIKSELAYLNKLSNKGKISFGNGDSDGKGDGTLKESLTGSLEKRMGIVPEKKEEDK